jgi:hypothetical protein
MVEMIMTGENWSTWRKLHPSATYKGKGTPPQKGGGWSAPHPSCFTPGKDPVPIVQEAGWAPGSVCMCVKNLTPTRIWSRTVQPVASHYTDWAIPVPLCVPPKTAQDQFLLTSVTFCDLGIWNVTTAHSAHLHHIMVLTNEMVYS